MVPLTAPAAADVSDAASPKGRKQDRLTKSSGPRIADGTKLGGSFRRSKNPPFLAARAEVFERVYAEQEARIAAKVRN